MNAVRTYTQINDSGNLIIENLPFSKGDFVEVLVIPTQNDEFNLLDGWKSLFVDIQKNETSKTINENDIELEIKKYRNSL